jgi:hypothetical protein
MACAAWSFPQATSGMMTRDAAPTIGKETLARFGQTASKFPFRWWGANSTLSDRH